MGNVRIQSLSAQVDVMEPVVEAALAYVEENFGSLNEVGSPAGLALLETVREYENALKEEPAR